MAAILAYGAYLPYHRLDRAAVRAALGAGGGKGTRSVASYDEDTTSMGVEAARRALAQLPADSPAPTAVYFATADPAYLEKSNASAVHAALGLDQAVSAYDFGGAVRSGVGALRAALERSGTTLVVLADLRGGLPGGPDEVNAGDAAAAFVVSSESTESAVASFLGGGAATVEVLERWRIPGEPAPQSWEERFGEAVLVEPVRAALENATKSSGIATGAIGAAALSGASTRALRTVGADLQASGARIVTVGLDTAVGYTGAAHAGLSLIAAIEDATAEETVAAVALADGADVLLFRAGPAAVGGVTLRQRVEAGGPMLPYPTFLTWRGHLRREPPRRPDNERPQAPATLRVGDWKFALVAGRCETCGRRQLPAQRVCIECGTADRMRPERIADAEGTVATFTLDRVSFTVHPPVIVAVVEFDGGGRFPCELTDLEPEEVHVGLRVRMTFRRTYTAQGVHNYFWKATPIRELPAGAR